MSKRSSTKTTQQQTPTPTTTMTTTTTTTTTMTTKTPSNKSYHELIAPVVRKALVTTVTTTQRWHKVYGIPEEEGSLYGRPDNGQSIDRDPPIQRI
jgi:hypothetical protein